MTAVILYFALPGIDQRDSAVGTHALREARASRLPLAEESALVIDEQDRTGDAVVMVHLHPQGLTPSRCSDIRPKRVST